MRPVTIAVMGAIGSGKSTFINTLSDSELATSTTGSDRVHPLTQEVQPSRSFLVDGQKIVLVDTPGYNNMTRSEKETLHAISEFLASSTTLGGSLDAIIILHSIMNLKLALTSKRNFPLFRELLCSPESLQGLFIVTTMWNEVDPEVGESREATLRQSEVFYKSAIDKGAQLLRYDGSVTSGYHVLRDILTRSQQARHALGLPGEDGISLSSSSVMCSVPALWRSGYEPELAELHTQHAERLQAERRKVQELEDALAETRTQLAKAKAIQQPAKVLKFTGEDRRRFVDVMVNQALNEWEHEWDPDGQELQADIRGFLTKFRFMAGRPFSGNPDAEGIDEEIAGMTRTLRSTFTSPISSPLMQLVNAALTSKNDGGWFLNLREDPETSQVALDFLQWMLDHPNQWPKGAHKNPSPHSTEIRDRLRRLVTRFSLYCDIPPTSLFLAGVECEDKEVVTGGAFADISRGVYKGQQVALKRLRLFQSITPEEKLRLKKRFYHETIIWRNLSHPNVLQLFGLEESIFKVGPCMVLPWMKYGSIRQMIATMLEKEHFDHNVLAQWVKKWVHQIAQGVAYLHEERIVHGDLRGDNILVDADKSIKVSDFGMALFAQGVSRDYASTRGGNVRWLSPELIDPELFELTSTRQTLASDVYSFGCVCVELYTGQAPFTGLLSEAQVHRKVPEGLRPPRPSFFGNNTMSETMWTLVNRCWEFKPSVRINIQEIVEFLPTAVI